MKNCPNCGRIITLDVWKWCDDRDCESSRRRKDNTKYHAKKYKRNVIFDTLDLFFKIHREKCGKTHYEKV